MTTSFTAEQWCLVAGGDLGPDAAVSRACAILERLGIATSVALTGAEALTAARGISPAIAVLELELADPSSYEVCRALREEFGESLPIVFVTNMRTQRRDEVAALLLGADDYFRKPLDQERFTGRIRRLLARAPASPRQRALTARELEVLTLLAEGRRTADIAETLCITRKTASTHIEHVLSKLEVHTQAQAVALALRQKLLES